MLQPKVLCSGVTHIAVVGLTIMLNGEYDTGFEYNMAHLKVYGKEALLKSRLGANCTKPYCAT